MKYLSLASLALLLVLMTGCVTERRHDAVRTGYQHSESTRTHEGNNEGAGLQPGNQSQQSESSSTHEERTTTNGRQD